jgi:hypothetical protein
VTHDLEREQLPSLAPGHNLEFTQEQSEQTVMALPAGELSECDLETVAAGKYFDGGPYPWWGPPRPWMGGGVFIGGPFNSIAIRW